MCQLSARMNLSSSSSASSSSSSASVVSSQTLRTAVAVLPELGTLLPTADAQRLGRTHQKSAVHNASSAHKPGGLRFEATDCVLDIEAQRISVYEKDPRLSTSCPWRRYGTVHKLHQIGGWVTTEQAGVPRRERQFRAVPAGSTPPPAPTQLGLHFVAGIEPHPGMNAIEAAVFCATRLSEKMAATSLPQSNQATIAATRMRNIGRRTMPAANTTNTGQRTLSLPVRRRKDARKNTSRQSA